MEPSPEDSNWFLRWAVVLDKVRSGATSGEIIELEPGECSTLLRGINALMGPK